MTYSRDELIFLLGEAAELEHMLCCAYLFAAFSTKRSGEHFGDPAHASKVISWTQSVSFVARQEMEHLSLVNNILTAIGGAPHFGRPQFPRRNSCIGADLTLEPLSPHSVERFIQFERPDDTYVAAATSPPQPLGVSPEPLPYRTLGELYGNILAGLRAFPGGEKALFIGPRDAQVDGAQLNIDFPRLGKLGGVYGITIFPVTGIETAQQAIELIVEQGEGGPEVEEEASHYHRFKEILHQMAEMPSFQPAYPVVTNPALYITEEEGRAATVDGAMARTLVTNPPARAVMDLFNGAYEVTLLLLIRLYAHTDEDDAELAALRYAAFFPMMTMVIRPLGEIIVTLPAFDDGRKGNAGPSFETFGSTQFLPHKQAAWIVLQERLDELATDCERLAGQLFGGRHIHGRLGYVAESLRLIARAFRDKVGG